MSGPDAPWHPVSWDEDIFGVKTARIRSTRPERHALGATLEEIRVWGAGVVHLLVDADADESIRAAEERGFRLVDVRVTLQWDVTPSRPVEKEGFVLKSAAAGDRDALEGIARSSYGLSRYYRDSRYSRERCGELYTRWIRQCCDAPSGVVLVADAGGTAAGFVACEALPGSASGSIALFGVAERHRGRGLASFLLGGARSWFSNVPVETVTVVTQGRNIDAQRAYQRGGFLIRQMQFWYHLWT